MLNITKHQKIANQDHTEISPHTCQGGYHQKNLQIHVSENLEKRESQYIVGGNINWCSYYGKMKFLPKTKNRYTK